MTDVLKYTDLYNNKEIREFFEYEYDTRKDSQSLRNGSYRQKQAYQIFSELKINKILNEFKPVIAGAIPLGIDLPDSDLIILLYCTDIKKTKIYPIQILLFIHFFRNKSEHNRKDLYGPFFLQWPAS